MSDEDSGEFRRAAEHVETCESCRQRLDQIAGASYIDDETRELLSDYPWDSLKSGVGFQPADAGSQVGIARQAIEGELDFLSPPSHPELLGRLGRYEIERVIGRGGMGIVLKAHDGELNRPVAVKVLAKHLAHSGAARQRFARKSRSAAAVVHEHVVAIHNVDVDGDVPFLVMQFVAGESLQSRVDRNGPLDAKEILRIGIQAAVGLAAAHEQGVIHRDIKPANILLENGIERALITDFGLARTVDDASLTQTGVIAGTPHYMSPEQANGQPTDHRTDLFSLGAVLYFMATGHPPFRAERAMGVLNRICHDRQKPLWQVADNVPDELSVLVDRLLDKQPSRRLASADLLRQQLVRLLAETQQPKHGLGRRVGRLGMRYPKRLMAIGVLVTIAMAVLIAELRLSSLVEGTSADESTVATQPDMAVQSVADRPGATAIGNDIPDSDSIARELDELRARLDKLNATDVFAVNSTDIESQPMQSLHQRLDRLQGSLQFEPPISLETTNESNGK